MKSFKEYFKEVDDSVYYDPKELKMGIAVEHEHTDNPDVAETITKHHLAEDPEYYTKLKTLNL